MRDKDLYLNENGDIEIGFDGDIRCVYDDDVLIGDIKFRLKTYEGDYELEPSCGASLDDFVGRPNTPEVGLQIEQQVFHALVHDGLVDASNLSVRVSPLSTDAVVILVTVANRGATYNIASSLDLLAGELQIID